MLDCDRPLPAPTVNVPVEVIVPPEIPLPVATDVTPCPSLVALMVIVSPDLTVVTLVPAAIVNVSLLLFAVAVPPELAVKFLNIACDEPLWLRAASKMQG